MRLLHRKPPQEGFPLLTTEALRQHDILTGAVELRQFSCRNCEFQWWSHVLRTKRVSECRKCRVRYDALGRKDEFGIGRFLCLPCKHSFYTWCTAIDTVVCFKCSELAGPPYINPRFKPRKIKRPVTEDLTTRRQHSHRVRNYSTVHDSTGSTEATFLTQNIGSDISVIIHEDFSYEMPAGGGVVPIPYHAIRDYDESDSSSNNDEGSDEDDDDVFSTTGEVGDVEQDCDDESGDVEQDRDDESEPEDIKKRRRKRKETSDTESSDSDLDTESSDEDEKLTVKSSRDSGIGTASGTGTGGSDDIGSADHSESKFVLLVAVFLF